MKQNNLNINPQMWKYGGLRFNEVNFLKFCLYIKLIMKRDHIENNIDYWYTTLAEVFVEGRPTVSLSQLLYYIYKWHQSNIMESGVSIRSGWFEYEMFKKDPCNGLTYNKVYEEVEEQVRTKDITIDMVMGYYNPKEPEDILPLYTKLYPNVVISLSRSSILYRFAYTIFQEIKDNTLGLPNKRLEYKVYVYQTYVSNELVLKDKPKMQLPAIYAFERWPTPLEYLPVQGKIDIKNKMPDINESFNIIDAANKVIKITTEDPSDRGKFDLRVLDRIFNNNSAVMVQNEENPNESNNIDDAKKSSGVNKEIIDRLKEYAKGNNKPIDPLIAYIPEGKNYEDPTFDIMEELANNPGGTLDDGRVVDQMINFASTHKKDISLKEVVVLELLKRRIMHNHNDPLSGGEWPTILNPFINRYSCSCGRLRGKLYEGDECGRCNSIVKYIGDEMPEILPNPACALNRLSEEDLKILYKRCIEEKINEQKTEEEKE